MVNTKIGISTSKIVPEHRHEHEIIIDHNWFPLSHVKTQYGTFDARLILVTLDLTLFSYKIFTPEAVKFENIQPSLYPSSFHQANLACAHAECDLIPDSKASVEMEQTKPQKLPFATIPLIVL